MFRTIQLIRPRPSELEGDIAGAGQVQSVAGQRRAKGWSSQDLVETLPACLMGRFELLWT